MDAYYFYFMDWDYWLRAGIRHRIVYLPELLSTYRLHSESNTVARSAQVAPELERMYESFFSKDDLPESIRGLRNRAMANMYFTSGGYYLNGGDRSSAKKMALRALRTFPGILHRPGMLHKLFFCLAGGHPAYAKARDAYYRFRSAERK